MDFKNKQEATAYYDHRYAEGYMAGRNREKERRIEEVVGSADLPPDGFVLDYGCGIGDLTYLFQRTLPGWTVIGTDISKVAISKGKKKYPKIDFLLDDDPQLQTMKFDLLVTHHVLEHVYDLHKVLLEMNRYLKPRGAMLHMLPCGNSGSYEHRLASLRKNGIEEENEFRFFFETESHLRRLTTERLATMLTELGFRLQREYYSFQFYGSVDVITTFNPLEIFEMTNPLRAKNIRGGFSLVYWTIVLLSLCFLRWPALLVNGYWNRDRRKRFSLLKRTIGDSLFLASVFFYPISQPVNRFLEWKSAKEWDLEKNDRGGAQMYLLFVR